MTDEELHELEDVASPGAGACGAQFTANTMACAFEALGISVGGSAMVPAEDEEKGTVAEQVGEMIMRVLAEDLRPSRIITSESLENAIACICASGGSTNGVLHMMAVAREAGVPLEMADFERISSQTPQLADMKPGGRYVATDLYRAGGVPLLLSHLSDAGLLHREQLTVTGRTIGEEADAVVEQTGQDVVRPATDPVKPQGGLAILHGNLAPEGAVVKVAGTERLRPDRPRPGLRVRGGLLRGGQVGRHQPRRRDRDPQRGPDRRPRDEGDAAGDRRDRRRRPWRMTWR